MTQAEFAKLLGVTPPAVSRWNARGYLVHDENGIVPEASRQRLIEKRGTDKALTNSQRRHLSPWSRGPACCTRRAELVFSEGAA